MTDTGRAVTVGEATMADEGWMANPAARHTVAAHMQTRSMQTLMGIVTGIVADEALHDLEVQMLSTWLSGHPDVISHWPGCAIAGWVRSVCEDGIVTEEERSSLLKNLLVLAGNDFAQTGSVQPEPTQLPVDDDRAIQFSGSVIAHTGTFLYGTRAKCERLSSALGATPADTITRKTTVLVIGSQVTPTWISESYGRKIMTAVTLRDAGHPIHIVSERHWFGHAQRAGHG